MGSHATDEYDTYAFFDSVGDMSTVCCIMSTARQRPRWLRKRAKVQDKNKHLSREVRIIPTIANTKKYHHSFYC